MKSMTCKQVQAILVDFIESEIPVDQRKRLHDHLSECYICSQEYNGLRDMINNTKDLSIPDPGDAFWASLPDLVLEDVNSQKAVFATMQGTPDATISNNENNIVSFTPKPRTTTNKHQTSTSPPTTAQSDAKLRTTVVSLFRKHPWGVRIVPLAATLLLAALMVLKRSGTFLSIEP